MIKRVVVRRAYFTETVEIQWVRLDGSVYSERHTFPPKAVQDARTLGERDQARADAEAGVDGCHDSRRDHVPEAV